MALFALLTACGHKHPSAPPAGGNTGEEVTCAGAGKTVDVDDEKPPDMECTGGDDALLCFGNWAAHCDPKGNLVDITNCRKDGLVCVTHKCTNPDECEGCRKCVPGDVACGEEGELSICEPDGSDYAVQDTCDESAGSYCNLNSGLCEDLCAIAERDRSYIGCDYFAVATSNSQLLIESQDADGLCHPFTFAVVVANPQGITAKVTVQSPGLPDRHVNVAPSEAKTIELPCSPELKGIAEADELFSVQTGAAAHHLTSNVPVTIYQFNPLEYQAKNEMGKKVFSYTEDASLLLPSSSLTGNYVVMSQPTLKEKVVPLSDNREEESHGRPGFLAVIGVETDPVEVEITSSAFTQPSADGAIPALEPGETHTFMLAQGEVLQLLSATPDDCPGEATDSVPSGTLHYCHVPREYDLTGTRIRAKGKVSVISGHDCVFLPYFRWACDHIEESMFPLETWGKSSFVSISETVKCQPTIPNLVRVYSETDDNRVTFAPEVHEPITLNRGEFTEFEADEDFNVSGSQAIMVGQFLLGQEYKGIRSAGSFAEGDPAFALTEPIEQWRNRYSFLAPESFLDNFVNITAGKGQVVLLDGALVSGFTTIKGTKYATARVPIMGGQHRVRSQEPFGILVYGFAPFTSYMVAGGLDLTPINTGPD